MTKITFYIIAFQLMFFTSTSLMAQKHTYFYNQKNTFSVSMNMNPRLIPMSNNGKRDPRSGGTYFQEYNKKNKLIKGDEKVNLMLNLAYGRIFGGNKMITVEFNYQRHHLTINRKLFSDNINYLNSEEYAQKGVPVFSSSPIYNIYDVNILYGRFNTSSLAPNKHIIQYGAGVRMHMLNKNQNYRLDRDTPITDLSMLVEEPDRIYFNIRFTFSYTYRILLTKNLNLDLGVITNAALTFKSGAHYNVYEEGKPIYDANYVDMRLGAETFWNMVYFKTGLSFDF